MKKIPNAAARIFLFSSIAIFPFFAQAQPQASADEILAVALKTLERIEENRANEIWDSTSAYVKTKISQTDFLADIQKSRTHFGVTRARSWAGVVRIVFSADSVDPPPGLYANADIATTQTDGKVFFEKISLRYEQDGWRLTGYIPRDKQ